MNNCKYLKLPGFFFYCLWKCIGLINVCVEPVLLDVLNISGTQSTARGFEGCIFRMEIDNVYPLKRAFQDPKPTFVKLYPEGKV